MSVINQMLKDLDQRQGEQNLSQSNQVPMNTSRSPIKLIVTTVIVVIVLNILGIMIWQLYSENQTLINNSKNLPEHNQQAEQLVQAIDKLTTKSDQQTSTQISGTTEEENALEVSNKLSQNPLVVEQEIVKTQQKIPNGISVVEKETLKDMTNKVTESPIVSESKVSIAEVKNEPLDTVKPQLSISRKQLTASELAANKIKQAEQALSSNRLSQAEKLFEDVLLMIPEHKAARKQLAALWFGRQSYQSAINVLSQGIKLDPNDSEFRLMKARIYLNQGKTVEAVNTLKVLSLVKDVEYQALLASNAQQISQHETAKIAYKLLSTLEPNAGRWWLGLAVAYDSNSEFEHAKDSYAQALEKIDLSENARQFVRQRLQELGE